MDVNRVPNCPGFERYWKHYQYMQSWIKTHQQVTEQISNNVHDLHKPDHTFKVPPVPPIRQSETSCTESLHSASQLRHALNSPVRREKRRSKRRRSRTVSLSTSCSSQTDDEYFEAELNAEFIKFMQKSAQHRKEREAMKNKESYERMDVDSRGVLVDDRARASAPTEQPGLRRTHEMKLLYGDQSLKIHGMETAQQLSFQQSSDRLKPLHWPNIPLRIEFT